MQIKVCNVMNEANLWPIISRRTAEINFRNGFFFALDKRARTHTHKHTCRYHSVETFSVLQVWHERCSNMIVCSVRRGTAIPYIHT